MLDVMGVVVAVWAVANLVIWMGEGPHGLEGGL